MDPDQVEGVDGVDGVLGDQFSQTQHSSSTQEGRFGEYDCLIISVMGFGGLVPFEPLAVLFELPALPFEPLEVLFELPAVPFEPLEVLFELPAVPFEPPAASIVDSTTKESEVISSTSRASYHPSFSNCISSTSTLTSWATIASWAFTICKIAKVAINFTIF